MEKEPEWLKNFDGRWEGERLTGLPETLPPTVKDYLTLIGPGDWKSTLDQFVQQVDNCIYLDTGVSFSSNWSDASDEEEELSEVDDGSYSRKMVFCAGPVKKDEVQSDHFLQFLRKALEQRVKEGLPPVAGQADFCQFVLSKEGTKEQSVKQEDDNSAADTRGQEATTSKTSTFYDPIPHQTGDIGKGPRRKRRLLDEHVQDTGDLERLILGNYVTLTKQLRPERVTPYLIQEGILTVEDKGNILRDSTTSEEIMTQAILDKVITRGTCSARLFIDVLRRSGHEHLADMLDETPITKPITRRTPPGMTPSQLTDLERVILDNYVTLTTQLRPESVIPYLIEERILTMDDRQQILAHVPLKDTTQTLLDKVLTRGTCSAQGFIDVLRRSGHEHLADMLYETPITKPITRRTPPGMTSSQLTELEIRLHNVYAREGKEHHARFEGLMVQSHAWFRPPVADPWSPVNSLQQLRKYFVSSSPAHVIALEKRKGQLGTALVADWVGDNKVTSNFNQLYKLELDKVRQSSTITDAIFDQLLHDVSSSYKPSFTKESLCKHMEQTQEEILFVLEELDRPSPFPSMEIMQLIDRKLLPRATVIVITNIINSIWNPAPSPIHDLPKRGTQLRRSRRKIALEMLHKHEAEAMTEEQMKKFQETVETTVKPFMPTDEETCNRKIKAAVETAVTKLSEAVGHWDKDGAWTKCLQGKLETERLALLHLNSAKSKDLCEKIIKEFDQPIRQKVGRGVYNIIGGFNIYVRDMDAVYKAYRQKTFGKGPAVEKVLEFFRTTETTRRNTIKDTDNKLVKEDRRVKEEQRKKQEAKAAAERAAEKERLARAEAARAAEAQRRAEAERAAEEAKRRAAEVEAKRQEALAEAARQAERAAEERARRRRRRKRSFLGIF